MTNLEKIRQMSTEEMAEMLIAFKDCRGNCPMAKEKHCYWVCDRASTIEQWLNSEVTES